MDIKTCLKSGRIWEAGASAKNLAFNTLAIDISPIYSNIH